MAKKGFNFENTYNEIQSGVVERQKKNGVIESYGESGKMPYVCGLYDGVYYTAHEMYSKVMMRFADIMKECPGISLEDALNTFKK